MLALLTPATGFRSFVASADLHKEHQLDDRCGSQQFAEGVDKEVIGQQRQLDEQHQ